MSEEKTTESVENTGSSADDLIKDPIKAQEPDNTGEGDGAGESKEKIDLENYVDKEQYEELEKKLGTQGEELGEYRNFIKDITPLMEKLEGKDEIVQAILDDKITPDLAKAVSEGKVSIDDATKVAEAHKEVKKDLGKKEYEKTDPEEIEKLISDKVDKIVDEKTTVLDKKISDSDDRRDFEEDVKEFVKNTSDFGEYSEKIADFFKENPKQHDIRVAYNAVKGEVLSAKQVKEDESQAAEKAKELAGNAAGGKSQGAVIVQEKDKIDELIGDNANPNAF
jgi:hypothetical protein